MRGLKHNQAVAEYSCGAEFKINILIVTEIPRV